VTEAGFVVVYMFVSIGVAAYFVGTTTLLVVEDQKKTGSYRLVGWHSLLGQWPGQHLTAAAGDGLVSWWWCCLLIAPHCRVMTAL